MYYILKKVYLKSMLLFILILNVCYIDFSHGTDLTDFYHQGQSFIWMVFWLLCENRSQSLEAGMI